MKTKKERIDALDLQKKAYLDEIELNEQRISEIKDVCSKLNQWNHPYPQDVLESEMERLVKLRDKIRNQIRIIDSEITAIKSQPVVLPFGGAYGSKIIDVNVGPEANITFKDCNGHVHVVGENSLYRLMASHGLVLETSMGDLPVGNEFVKISNSIGTWDQLKEIFKVYCETKGSGVPLLVPGWDYYDPEA